MTATTASISYARLDSAVAAWREALGDVHVVLAGQELADANLATFIPSGHVLAIIRPSTTAEVQVCMRIAHRERIPVYPVSRGRNWGYGSRTPPLGGAVLMELLRMDRIIEFNEELAYVRVQPGVTFEQLSTFLEGSVLQIDATAGPHDGSIVGNALERGRSHGPMTVTSRPAADFQIVLADGRLIHTGSRRFPRASHAASEPFPVGPDVAGLFFESNVGIVAEMTLWLAKRANYTRVLRLGLRDHEAMRQIIAPIRVLMLDGLLNSGGVLMINEERRRHAMRMGSHHVLPSHYRADGSATSPQAEPKVTMPLWPEHDLAWLCTATVYSSDHALAERRLELVKEALSPYAVVSHEMSLANVGARPHPEYLQNPLWQKTTGQPPDLDRDRIGYIFVAPVAPAIGDEVGHVYGTMHRLILEHGFEPFINLRYWDARSVVFVGSIVYDGDDAEASAHAVRCYDRILETLGADGYIPYRMPTFAMQKLPRPIDDWGGFWGDVKRALDPHDVLSPGRYDFRYCWPVESSPLGG